MKQLQKEEGVSEVRGYCRCRFSRNTVCQQWHIVQLMWERQASSNHGGRCDIEMGGNDKFHSHSDHIAIW